MGVGEYIFGRLGDQRHWWNGMRQGTLSPLVTCDALSVCVTQIWGEEGNTGWRWWQGAQPFAWTSREHETTNKTPERLHTLVELEVFGCKFKHTNTFMLIKQLKFTTCPQGKYMLNLKVNSILVLFHLSQLLLGTVTKKYAFVLFLYFWLDGSLHRK